MMYIHSNNEIVKRINVSKIANNISTMGDNSIAAGCNSRLITITTCRVVKPVTWLHTVHSVNRDVVLVKCLCRNSRNLLCT